MKKVLLLEFTLMVFVACSREGSINDQAYYFERLNLAELWRHSTGSSQTIAIIDSGITDEAMELHENNIVDVYNVFDGSRNVLDENEYAHGTQMASLIVGNGEANVYGIAPSAQIIIIKAFEGYGSRTSMDHELVVIY